MADSGTASLSGLARLARRAERRLRAASALEVGLRASVFALAAAIVVLAGRKTGHVAEGTARGLLCACVLAVLVAALVAYRKRLPSRAGAVALDRHHGLADRLASALAFADVKADERTPFMAAAMDDARAFEASVDPRRAVPLRTPRDLRAALGLALALVGLAVFEVRNHRIAPVAATLDAVDVTADDVDAMREFLREMEKRAETDEAKAATAAFNQLVEDLAARRLDRTEAFRRMQALEDKLLEGREADAKALEGALEKMGEEMKASDMTKAAGEALANKNLAVAEKKLKELAASLRQKGAGADKAQLEKMRDALKRAADSQKNRRENLEKRREELEKQLLREKQKADAGVTEQEKSLLTKKERELDRLNRDLEDAKSAERQLDRLDRELEKAAEDLMKDLGLSADDLDQSAEDLNRMAREAMTQEEKEQLRQKLQELREMLRQQGQGGQKQMVRLRRFQNAARGGSGGSKGDGKGDEGEEGEGQKGQGQQGQGQGQQGGEGQNGPGGKKGQGQSGETWVLGPNGEKIMMLSSSRRAGSQSGGQGSGGDPSGKGAGTSHDEHVQGKATDLKGGTQDTELAGQDTGQGASRSEVIHGAAERGFANRGYEKVYREYHTVAEEALGKDEIPGGYRFYVRRYFQLIRPREEFQLIRPREER